VEKHQDALLSVGFSTRSAKKLRRWADRVHPGVPAWCRGIVSETVGGTYQSGRCSVWIKVLNPASIAVQRERSGDFGIAGGSEFDQKVALPTDNP
jgi:hypothetical protein